MVELMDINSDGGIKLTWVIDVVLSMCQDFEGSDEVQGIHLRICGLSVHILRDVQGKLKEYCMRFGIDH